MVLDVRGPFSGDGRRTTDDELEDRRFGADEPEDEPEDALHLRKKYLDRELSG